MKKNLTVNYIFNMSYQILLIIVPIITAPYLSRVLGAEGIGRYSYAYAMVSYFTLFAVLGTNTFGQRAVSYVQDDVVKRSEAFWETLLARVVLASATLAVYAVYLLKSEGDLRIMVILGLYIVNVVFDVSWFLQGMEEFSKTVVRSLVFKILQIIFIFVFVKDADDLLIYIGGTAVLTVAGSFSLWLYLPGYIRPPGGLKIKPFRNFKTIFELFIPTVAIQIYTVLDKTMIGWFTDTALENGYYEQAEKIVKMCMTLITALGTVMLPRLANTFKTNDAKKFRHYLYTSYRFVWFLGVPILLGIIAVSDNFTTLFFGNGFEKVKVLLPVFSPLVLLIPLGYVTGGQYLVATGKQMVLARVTFIGAAVNVVLNLILIPRFYSEGAAAASVIAEFSVTLAGFMYLKKNKQIEVTRIMKEAKNYLTAGLIMFTGLMLLRSILQDGVIKLMVMVAAGGSIYIIILLLIKDELLMPVFLRSGQLALDRIRRLGGRK